MTNIILPTDGAADYLSEQIVQLELMVTRLTQRNRELRAEVKRLQELLKQQHHPMLV
jgi:chaperonin cofactor prefoldin